MSSSPPAREQQPATALAADELRRVELTTALRDTDAIPKVDGAGEVREVGGRRVQVMHNGVLIAEGCYYGAWMTEIIRRLRGHHEPQEEVVFHALVQALAQDPPRRPVMIELGSYWAYYSLWFARALPGATTIMVEPDPRNLDVGRLNFMINDLEGTFVRACIGAAHGEVDWFRCDSDGRLRRTPAASLAGLLADHGLERADLVLCDAQGAEVELLEASRELLQAGAVRYLLLSTHHHSLSGDALTHQRCRDLLRAIGAHVIAEHSVSESGSGDGLIAVSFDERDAGLEVPVTIVRARDSLFGELEYDLARAPERPTEDDMTRAATPDP
ncbi:MAG: hypothetical protein QOI73_2980 [Solirubrobacteraceae bacterium]|nr:hypothetical protein [Solirubrobacteraceae bacterium]